MSSTSDTINNFTDEERKIYNAERMKLFKITISVCAIYGIFALILLLVGLFTSFGNVYIFDKLLPFSITYIIGTIVIIIYLSTLIYNYQIKKIDNSITYENQLCPDYWKLEKEEIDDLTDANGRKYIPDDVNINLFKYKCVIDDNLLRPDLLKENAPEDYFNIAKQGNLYTVLDDDKNNDKSALNKEGQQETYNNFKKIIANMNGYDYSNLGLRNRNTNSLKKPDNTFYKDDEPVPVACDKLYPLYLSAMDAKNLKENPNDDSNKFRCAYAKTCKVPWTDVGCY